MSTSEGPPPHHSASSLSPHSIRNSSQSACNEEYLRNMNGQGHPPLSASSTRLDVPSITFDTSPPVNGVNADTSLSRSASLNARKRRRAQTASVALGRKKSGLSPGLLSYGESPYSQEYLQNMDGVRLVANLSNNSDDVSKVDRSSASLAKSILKKSRDVACKETSAASTRSSSRPATRTRPSSSSGNDFRSKFDQSGGIEASDCLPVAEELKAASASGDERRSSSASEKSLHLSDLPMDPSDVYTKFRNFDSHMSALPVTSEAKVSRKSTDRYREDQLKRCAGHTTASRGVPSAAVNKNVAKTSITAYEVSRSSRFKRAFDPW